MVDVELASREDDASAQVVCGGELQGARTRLGQRAGAHHVGDRRAEVDNVGPSGRVGDVEGRVAPECPGGEVDLVGAAGDIGTAGEVDRVGAADIETLEGVGDARSGGRAIHGHRGAVTGGLDPRIVAECGVGGELDRGGGRKCHADAVRAVRAVAEHGASAEVERAGVDCDATAVAGGIPVGVAAAHDERARARLLDAGEDAGSGVARGERDLGARADIEAGDATLRVAELDQAGEGQVGRARGDVGALADREGVRLVEGQRAEAGGIAGTRGRAVEHDARVARQGDGAARDGAVGRKLQRAAGERERARAETARVGDLERARHHVDGAAKGVGARERDETRAVLEQAGRGGVVLDDRVDGDAVGRVAADHQRAARTGGLQQAIADSRAEGEGGPARASVDTGDGECLRGGVERGGGRAFGHQQRVKGGGRAERDGARGARAGDAEVGRGGAGDGRARSGGIGVAGIGDDARPAHRRPVGLVDRGPGANDAVARGEGRGQDDVGAGVRRAGDGGAAVDREVHRARGAAHAGEGQGGGLPGGGLPHGDGVLPAADGEHTRGLAEASRAGVVGEIERRAVEVDGGAVAEAVGVIGRGGVIKKEGRATRHRNRGAGGDGARGGGEGDRAVEDGRGAGVGVGGVEGHRARAALGQGARGVGGRAVEHAGGKVGEDEVDVEVARGARRDIRDVEGDITVEMDAGVGDAAREGGGARVRSGVGDGHLRRAHAGVRDCPVGGAGDRLVGSQRSAVLQRDITDATTRGGTKDDLTAVSGEHAVEADRRGQAREGVDALELGDAGGADVDRAGALERVGREQLGLVDCRDTAVGVGRADCQDLGVVLAEDIEAARAADGARDSIGRASPGTDTRVGG